MHSPSPAIWCCPRHATFTYTTNKEPSIASQVRKPNGQHRKECVWPARQLACSNNLTGSTATHDPYRHVSYAPNPCPLNTLEARNQHQVNAVACSPSCPEVLHQCFPTCRTYALHTATQAVLKPHVPHDQSRLAKQLNQGHDVTLNTVLPSTLSVPYICRPSSHETITHTPSSRRTVAPYSSAALTLHATVLFSGPPPPFRTSARPYARGHHPSSSLLRISTCARKTLAPPRRSQLPYNTTQTRPPTKRPSCTSPSLPFLRLPSSAVLILPCDLPCSPLHHTPLRRTTQCNLNAPPPPSSASTSHPLLLPQPLLRVVPPLLRLTASLRPTAATTGAPRRHPSPPSRPSLHPPP